MKGSEVLKLRKKKKGIEVNVITSFYEKQRYKQIEFERKMLRDISFAQIEEISKEHFAPYLHAVFGYQTPLEEVAIDYAVEAYLLGASLSRLGYFGESIEEVRRRSEQDEKQLARDLFDYWSYWTDADEPVLASIYASCESFIGHWWRSGFDKGEKRRRLRLH